MLKVIQVLVVFTLFVAQSLGSQIQGSVGVGRPAPVDKSNKCIKDLLLVVDTSSSIEKKNFIKNVQPFLVNFVKHPHLNVNRDGTRIAIILFSSKGKTRTLLNFNVEYDAEKIAKKIGDLKWDNVFGRATRTGKALGIADKQIFKKDDPDNVRPGVQDVILLVTDGEPTNPRKAKMYAQKLKDKHILIVGAAIGPKREQVLPKLQLLATKGHVVIADFAKLDTVISTIIAQSCVRPASCSCPITGGASVRLQPGQSTAMFEWPEPKLNCEQGAPAVADKISTFKSPHMFPAGQHTITYYYTMQNGVKLNCVVSVAVEDPLCGGEEFNSKTEVCCCGEIHQKQKENKCCGKFYHDSRLEKCCDAYANRVAIGESCP